MVYEKDLGLLASGLLYSMKRLRKQVLSAVIFTSVLSLSYSQLHFN